MRRIGLLGGTFNPPHYGHLRPALEAMEHLGLARVVLMPAGVHPFKDSAGLTPAIHRLAMTRLAVEGPPPLAGLEVSDLEVGRGGVAYTVDTLAEVRRLADGVVPVLLLGADLLPEFHLWHRYREVSRLAHLCVLERPGYEVSWRECEAMGHLGRLEVASKDQLAQLPGGEYNWMAMPVTPLGISSSDLRRRVAAGLDIRCLTPGAVVHYIQAHGLFRQP